MFIRFAHSRSLVELESEFVSFQVVVALFGQLQLIRFSFLRSAETFTFRHDLAQLDMLVLQFITKSTVIPPER